MYSSATCTGGGIPGAGITAGRWTPMGINVQGWVISSGSGLGHIVNLIIDRHLTYWILSFFFWDNVVGLLKKHSREPLGHGSDGTHEEKRC